MDTPATTEELLERLDANGWSTAAFRRTITAADVGLSPPPGQPDGGAPHALNAAPAAAAGCPAAPPRISDYVAREAALAYGRVRPFVRNTPLDASPWLSGLAPGAGCRASLKMESEQHTGAFKARGAVNKLLSLPPEVLSRGVYAASTGNHALAVLYACEAISASRTPPPSATAATAAGAAGAAAVGAGCGDGAAPVAATDGQAVEAGLEGVAAGGWPLRPLLYLPETASPYKVGAWGGGE
ncbi:putative threonine dehydratase [Tetrabaena socialis]|uniref:Putative threonine dehydratase n=1 Tax=Tetrabaena socialis TaxID=47790 RepID=A0A2J7ZUX4_9CHLO|nr:putative threonine dehydratase [Tetrabaena socialis]|eukprot:PNH04059.1 putative threonine dehydratase [Tetrabaena socialis]